MQQARASGASAGCCCSVPLPLRGCLARTADCAAQRAPLACCSLTTRTLAAQRARLATCCQAGKTQKEQPQPRTGKGQRGRGQQPRGPRRSGDDSGALDVRLMTGDLLMLVATEMASSRIPPAADGFMVTMMTFSWVTVALAKGDYRRAPEAPDVLSVQMGVPLLRALLTSTTTWGLFVPTVVALYACLVSHNVMESVPLTGSGRSAAAEVLVAALLTVTCWRGIYTYLL